MNLLKFCAFVALVAAASAANATFTINIVQSGPDVVMTGSGSIDTTGFPGSLGLSSCGILTGAVSSTSICVGSGSAADTYSNVLTPPVSAVTTGLISQATTATGPAVYLFNAVLGLPGAYVSGTPISNSSTFSGRTIAGLGLTNGATRTFTLPSGDTIVLNVGAPIPPVATATASIPTLSEYALVGLTLLMAMIGIAAVRRGRTGN